jgi:hypothetical protein
VAALIDIERASEEFRRQGQLVFIADAVSADRLAILRGEADRLEPTATRIHVPLVRRAGTVGGRRLRREAPSLAALYRELRSFAERITERPLFEKAADDDHAVALYCYREGDFMASHVDRCGSAPHGSYSVTVGLVDESTSRLACDLDGGAHLDLTTAPGSLTIYNGSRVAHAVTRLGRGERRIVLSGSYRTQARPDRVPYAMQRVVEGVLYFGWPGGERRR